MVHLKRYHKGSNAAAQPAYEHKFQHAVCAVGTSEDSAFLESLHGYPDAASCDCPEYYSITCEERHSACGINHKGWLVDYDENATQTRLDLRILRACRQIYREANHLLWTTNTFAFQEEVTFEKFMQCISPTHKSILSKLHIRLNYGDGTLRLWKKVMRLSLINGLRGLRTLHLSLDQDVGQGSQLLQHFHELSPEALTEPILRLRLLPLKHVTVILSDNRHMMNPLGKKHLTFHEKREIAEYLRNKLLNPTEEELLLSEANAKQGDREHDIDCQRAACQDAIFQLCRKS